MKRTVRTRGGRRAAASVPGKARKLAARGAPPAAPDPETARLRRLDSLVRWVAGSAPPSGRRPVRRDPSLAARMANLNCLSEGAGRPPSAAPSPFSRSLADRASAGEDAQQHLDQLKHHMRIATMGEMSAALAHELGQPIAAIVNYCNGSLRRLATGRWTVQDLTEAMNETRAEAMRARDIIQNVTRFVRNAPPDRTVVEIGALVASAGNLIRPALRRHGIELRVDLAAPATPINANPVEVEQVLVNLLRNSMESVAGSPHATRRIELRARADGEELHVCVRDGGTGFSPEAAKRAFDPFFTTKAEGMGMGLAICRTIVEHHGGRIWAEPGGSSVHFTLPISEAHDAAA